LIVLNAICLDTRLLENNVRATHFVSKAGHAIKPR